MEISEVIKEKIEHLDNMEAEVNAWEAEFLENIIDREYLSEKQIAVIEKMYKKYKDKKKYVFT